MISVGIKVNTVKLRGDGDVHVYEYGKSMTLCGKDKAGRVTKLGGEASCRNCWGLLYLLTSLSIDNLFGYPASEDVEDKEEEVEAA